MKHPGPSPLMAVVRRECRRMTERRVYFAACVVLPLFSLFFMVTIFGNGQMENLPVGVVDGDQTATSRGIVRSVEAVPTFRLVRRYADEAAARADLQRKVIYGYLSIPPGFEAAVGGNREVTLAYYYHYALMSVGSEVDGAFRGLLGNLSVTPVVGRAAALGVGEDEVEAFLLPVTSQDHPLFNPGMDYSVYLTYPFFFVLLQALLLLVTTYALGSEGKDGTSADWLAAAGGNIGVAVAGKLLPYTVVFMVTSVLADYVCFGPARLPLEGGLWPLHLTAFLFVAATQALAVFLFALFPALSLVISVVSMVGSLGATLCGVTFPVSHMYAPVRFASCLLPVRHFVEIGHTLLYGDYGYAYLWPGVASLLLFLLPPLLSLPRLKRLLISRKYDHLE